MCAHVRGGRQWRDKRYINDIRAPIDTGPSRCTQGPQGQTPVTRSYDAHTHPKHTQNGLCSVYFSKKDQRTAGTHSFTHIHTHTDQKNHSVTSRVEVVMRSGSVRVRVCARITVHRGQR